MHNNVININNTLTMKREVQDEKLSRKYGNRIIARGGFKKLDSDTQ